MSYSKITLLPIILLLAFAGNHCFAQQVTGVWKGRINNKKVEVKIIQKGDSLTGTSYYFDSPSNYRRYSIKGYFDQQTNSVVWWDDQLLANKGGNAGRQPSLSVADFNCPGGGEMYLDGKAGPKEDGEDPNGEVNLEKVGNPDFRDEWDFIIDNFTVGGNDPYLIDSIGLIAFHRDPPPETFMEKRKDPPFTDMVSIPPPQPEAKPLPPKTIEEKFTIRKKVFTTEIPLTGDSIELRFFDNVQVDGDSITLFLNDKMIYTHIRLTAQPFIIKLPVSELNDSNELTMVAENLGDIPPNTAYMVAIVGDKRYEVNLSSTEETSGMIRLRKTE